MITPKELKRLQHGASVAHHLEHFVQKWVWLEDPAQIPDHIADILIRLSRLRPCEQREFFVVNDELYVIPQKTERITRKNAVSE